MSPKIAVIEGYTFFFYATDAGEPPHIHVRQGSGKAKFWLTPIRCARHRGFSQVELNQIERILAVYADEFLQKWREYFEHSV